MDNMDVPSSGAPVLPPDYSSPAPAAPAAAPAPVPIPAPVPAPTYQAGGKPGGFFNSISLSDVIIGTLAMTSLILVIKYYRDKIRYTKQEYPVIRKDLDDLRKEMDDIRGMTNPSMGY